MDLSAILPAEPAKGKSAQPQPNVIPVEGQAAKPLADFGALVEDIQNIAVEERAANEPVEEIVAELKPQTPIILPLSLEKPESQNPQVVDVLPAENSTIPEADISLPTATLPISEPIKSTVISPQEQKLLANSAAEAAGKIEIVPDAESNNALLATPKTEAPDKTVPSSGKPEIPLAEQLVLASATQSADKTAPRSEIPASAPNEPTEKLLSSQPAILGKSPEYPVQSAAEKPNQTTSSAAQPAASASPELLLAHPVSTTFDSFPAPLESQKLIHELPRIPLGQTIQPYPTAAATTPARVASIIAEQISVQISNSTNPKIELRLDPPELGRVVIHLSPSDNGIQAVISAERPEIVDLMRRHADILAAAFEKAGFAGSEFSFQSGEKNNGAADQNAQGQIGDGDLAAPDEEIISLTYTSGSALDIRL